MIETILKSVYSFILAVTPAQWYVLGAVVGGSGLLISITAYIKRRHLKQTMNKLESWFVQANLVFWGLAITLLGFIVTNGTNISLLFPYLGIHAPQLIVLATTLFSFSKGIRKWFVDRKASKRTLIDDVTAAVQAPESIPDAPAPSPTPPQSPQPGSDLLS